MKNTKFIKKMARVMLTILAIMVFTTVTAASASAAEVGVTTELRAGQLSPITLSAGNTGTGVDEVDSMFENFYAFISGILHIVGALITLYGLLQIGMSVSQHDPSQRMQGFLFLAGGVIILFSPEILTMIQG